MGLDIYFYKFDPQGISSVEYQEWFGDVYTEIDIKLIDDHELFQQIYPQYDLNNYELTALHGDGSCEFTRIKRVDEVHGNIYDKNDRFAIDTTMMPYKRVVIKNAPVTEVKYFRLGYGMYILGEPGEIDIHALWHNFEKFVKHGVPDEKPYMSKTNFVAMLQLDEFKELSEQFKSREIDVNNIDCDIVEISW